MGEKTHGTTASGKPITEGLVDELEGKADAGYDVDETLRRRGGRPIGASVESVRLDPELREALAQRAKRDQESPSAVIRKTLRTYLQTGCPRTRTTRGVSIRRESREHSPMSRP